MHLFFYQRKEEQFPVKILIKVLKRELLNF